MKPCVKKNITYIHLAWINDKSSPSKRQAYHNIRKTAQTKLRIMCNQWWSNKAAQLQLFSDSNNMKQFYASLKTVYGPQSAGSSPVTDTDGSTLLYDKTKILEGWADHFNNLLNRESTISIEAIEELPQRTIIQALAREPNAFETMKPMEMLSNGKAPGSDAIPAEVYKDGGDHLVHRMTKLFQQMWNKEQIPQEYKVASIVRLYKRKGNRHICDNHRGIALLVLAGKILARIMLNRFTHGRVCTRQPMWI